ncbi:MAG TPA: hypothetical protein VMT70_12080 [Vicinamibacteria bacterium]|nr:hypothetical protein [Vicinamibacteria bacterium]
MAESPHPLRPPRPSGFGSVLVPALALLLGLLVVSCGSSNPDEPSTGQPGGTVTGLYTLQLVPAATCPGGRPVTFPVQVTETGTTPHPGVQLLMVSSDPALLELELKYTDDTLEGGVGTTGDGQPSAEGPQTWVNSIASGKTTQTSDGRGEVVSGVLRGYLEIEGVITACWSANHSFTLRAK